MIDVVTDDMPFLVDTITMTLAAHDVTAELVVHPQLTVRRDVTGSLREVVRPVESVRPVDRPRIPGTDGAPDQIAESWSHIEVAKLAAGKGDAIAPTSSMHLPTCGWPSRTTRRCGRRRCGSPTNSLP